MSWQQVSFPEDVDPLDEPKAMIREAEAIYEENRIPERFLRLSINKSSFQLRYLF